MHKKSPDASGARASGRLAKPWLAERGFIAIVRPNYIGRDLGVPLANWLRRTGGVRELVSCSDARGEPDAFLRCPPYDDSFAHLTTAYPSGNSLVFDLDERFAVYMWANICHIVAGPEDALPAMLGESIADAARRLQTELDETPNDAGTITSLVRDLGGPLAKLVGDAP